MLSKRTDNPAVIEMRHVGRLLESLVNSKLTPSKGGSADSPAGGNCAVHSFGGEPAAPSGQAGPVVVKAEGNVINSSPDGVSSETWRALAPHVEHVANGLEALQLQLSALTALAEVEKESCAAVLLPAGGDAAVKLLATSGGMKTLLNLDSNGGQENGDTRAFLERCRQAHERGEARPQWRTSGGIDFWLTMQTATSLPGCKVALVHLVGVATDHATIAECRRLARAHGLTRRQVEVLELLACGLGNREIAHRLKISYHTARAHLRDIYARLSVSNRIEAVNAVRSWSGNPPLVATTKRTGSINGTHT